MYIFMEIRYTCDKYSIKDLLILEFWMNLHWI